MGDIQLEQLENPTKKPNMLRNFVHNGARLLGKPRISAHGSMSVFQFSTKRDSFLSGSSSVYVEQMFDAWKKDPQR